MGYAFSFVEVSKLAPSFVWSEVMLRYNDVLIQCSYLDSFPFKVYRMVRVESINDSALKPPRRFLLADPLPFTEEAERAQ